ncbi:MAG: HAMP domain-containing histidine kinase [Nocardioidaceae bacterium]|nr:HAMP domain-containing histidine kinase [Nocardioidaceae bacterium]
MPRFHYRRSLASRVILLTTFAVGVSVALVSFAAYMTVRHQLQSSMDQSLRSRAEVVSQYPIDYGTIRNIPAWMLGATDTAVAYINADGEGVTAKAPQGDIHLGGPEAAVAAGKSDFSCRTVSTDNGDYRVTTVPASEPGYALVIAQSMAANEDSLNKLGLVMLIFGLAGVIAAALAGWGVARNGLRPVRRLTDAAERIARTDKLEPIEVEGNDEIARMARAFNAMLAALSASRDRQRRLVADAGHELRTPLTSLRTNLDLLTQADRQGGLSESARTELLDDVRFQIEELTTLIGDLTELAREDSVHVTLEPVDLADITDRAVQRVRRRASSLEFDVHTDAWWVTGEPNALERAVTNLLDNAAKWSPPLGVVTVRLEEGTLLVADQGHGIAEEDLPHVFDRFYRSRDSRTMPGSGLGLAIVRQVAERHGGDVRAGHTPEGGASFWFSVPGSVEAPASERVRADSTVTQGS